LILRHIGHIILMSGACLPACSHSEVVEGFPDNFVGVGVELQIVRGRPTVVRTLKGGPAAIAGAKKGDRIMAVDEVSTEDMSLGNVVMLLRGMPETQVTLAIDRRGVRVILVLRRQKMRKVNQVYRPKNN